MVISSSHDADIERALIRARARGLKLRRVERITDGANVVVRYAVQSASRQQLTHRVAVEYTANGVTTYCSCEAGQANRMCQHVAAALAMEGFADLPDGWVEEIEATRAATVEAMPARKPLTLASFRQTERDEQFGD